ncbi:hypothetical protein [Allostreptomyces psammosilenae]|uniref:Uncharacterized protein n=1 Tax=Allostreptomyces psammosilenae TaxID=1892865 RepID=A0A852ZNS2_9ACTN|nr:hypothetical protein [Allostreptomyces psammosilenae]NYI04043.1 hypothetical protein [Allostreptomyces psammosilenae]
MDLSANPHADDGAGPAPPAPCATGSDGFSACHGRALRPLVADAASDLVLIGGHALRAHGVLDRPCAGLGLATDSQTPLPDICRVAEAALAAAGLAVRVTDRQARTAGIAVRDPDCGHTTSVRLFKDALDPTTRSAARCGSAIVPVAGWKDTGGLKVRALLDRGAPQDYVDLHALSDRRTWPELENLGRRHAPELDPDLLLARLAMSARVPDDRFARLGLDEDGIGTLRVWLQGWVTDLSERLAEERVLWRSMLPWLS